MKAPSRELPWALYICHPQAQALGKARLSVHLEQVGGSVLTSGDSKAVLGVAQTPVGGTDSTGQNLALEERDMGKQNSLGSLS